jgi:group I intron endonuclease
VSAESGIYAIVNRVTGHRYVGQTKHLRRREREHFKALAEGAHHCQRLQRAFEKYGRDAFSFEAIERVPVEGLDEIEQGYLDAGFAAGTLYNTATCAEAPARGVKRSPELCAANGARKREFFSDPVMREENRRRVKAALAVPEVRAKMRTRRTDAGRAAISVAQKKRYSTPEGMAGHAAAMALRGEGWRKQLVARGRGWRSNRTWVAHHDEGIRARSENPEWLARMTAQNKAFAADPGWRAAIKARHSTEEARRNHGEATRRIWAARRADPVAYAAWCKKISDGRRRKKDGANV